MGVQARRKKLEWLEEQAEKAYETMYDARFGTAGHYNDVKEFLTDAISLARELELDDEAERLTGRLSHIKALYRSQFG